MEIEIVDGFLLSTSKIITIEKITYSKKDKFVSKTEPLKSLKFES